MVDTHPLNIGILALQGASDLHKQILERLLPNICVSKVKAPVDLEGLDGIVLPGGESTVMSKLLDSSMLTQPLKAKIEEGLCVFATCAGLILLADHFKALNVKVVRNAYGTQIDSFEGNVDFLPTGKKSKVFFIRAPRISFVGKGVEVLATHRGEPVGVTQQNIMALTCHPEVGGSLDFHRFFVDQICQRVTSL